MMVQEPTRRLRTMALLCDAAESSVASPAGGSVASSVGGAPVLLKGGELATAMCAHARHGDPVVLALVRRVLRPVSPNCRDRMSEVSLYSSP